MVTGYVLQRSSFYDFMDILGFLWCRCDRDGKGGEEKKRKNGSSLGHKSDLIICAPSFESIQLT